MTEKEKLKVQLLTAQGAFTRLELGIGDLVYEVEEGELNVHDAFDNLVDFVIGTIGQVENEINNIEHNNGEGDR